MVVVVKQDGKKLQDFFSISRIVYRVYRVALGFDNGFRCFDLPRP